MSIFSNNLRFLRIQKGLNLDGFESIGVKKGTMSNYELGKTEPKFDLLLELSKFFGISIDDFLTKDIESLYNNGNINGNVDGNITSSFMLQSGKTESTNIVELPVVSNEDSEMVSIPIVDISVAAGSGAYNQDYIHDIDSIRLPRSMTKNGTHLCVRIKGDSMSPTLLDGGYLVVRLLDRSEWEYIRDGHVYVVAEKEGRAFVKRVKNRFKEHGFIVCNSDNADVMRFNSFNLFEEEINTIWYAEWYFTAKMPNINDTYYNRLTAVEESIEELKRDFSLVLKR